MMAPSNSSDGSLTSQNDGRRRLKREQLSGKTSLFRFRLRTFLLTTTLFAVWLGLHLRSTLRQRESVQAVRRLGGSVQYDFHYVAGKFGIVDADYRATSAIPKQLIHWLGIDFFHTVVAANLDGTRVPENAKARLIQSLTGFPKLRVLRLLRYEIPEEDLSHLLRLPLLERVDLSYTSVNDDAMPYLGDLVHLRDLDLGHTRVGGRGFHRLTHLPNLRSLNLTLTPVKDEALEQMKRMTKLEYVSLFGCQYLSPEKSAVVSPGSSKVQNPCKG